MQHANKNSWKRLHTNARAFGLRSRGIFVTKFCFTESQCCAGYLSKFDSHKKKLNSREGVDI